MLLLYIVAVASCNVDSAYDQWFDTDTQRCFCRPKDSSGWSYKTGTWQEGREACQKDGGDLAVIETAELWGRLTAAAESWLGAENE